MKKTCLLLIFLSTTIALSAQVRLEVEGDAKIFGKLDIIQAVGDSSIFIGADVGLNDDGANENTFVGTSAGRDNTIGRINAFFGHRAGQSNTGGDENAFFGGAAGFNNTTGSFNTFFGRKAGFPNTTGGSNAFFGRNAGLENATGDSNAFFGHGAGSSYNNNRSTLLGFDAETTDTLDLAIAIGYRAEVACDNCAVIGGTGAEAVNVGIGTTTPGAALHVVGSGFFGDDFGFLPASVGGGIRIFKDGNFGSIFAYDYSVMSPINMKLQQAGGNVGIGSGAPSCKLDVSGNICSNGNVITSDERFKKQIKRIENPLAKIARLEGYTYQMRTNEFQSRNFLERSNLGLLAQNVEKVFPELVTTLQDGYKAVNYDGLIPVLVEGMNEQQTIIFKQEAVIQAKGTEITDLKTENDNQNEVIDDLQDQITELKSLVEQLLTQNAETPKNTSYVLPLEQQSFLAQNQPNPFRENTIVDYFVPATVQKAHIQVTSVDGKILGQVSITETGKGQVTIQSKSYPAGTYFYSLVLDGQVVETKQMVLAR